MANVNFFVLLLIKIGCQTNTKLLLILLFFGLKEINFTNATNKKN